MQEFISYRMNRQSYNENGLSLESLNSTIKESSPTIVILSLRYSLRLKVNANGTLKPLNHFWAIFLLD